jgi:hypothetical protein
VSYSLISECILVTDILERDLHGAEIVDYNRKFPTPHTKTLYKCNNNMQGGLLDMKVDFRESLVCCFKNGTVVTFDIMKNVMLKQS